MKIISENRVLVVLLQIGVKDFTVLDIKNLLSSHRQNLYPGSPEPREVSLCSLVGHPLSSSFPSTAPYCSLMLLLLLLPILQLLLLVFTELQYSAEILDQLGVVIQANIWSSQVREGFTPH